MSVVYFGVLAVVITAMSAGCTCGFCRLLLPRFGL